MPKAKFLSADRQGDSFLIPPKLWGGVCYDKKPNYEWGKGYDKVQATQNLDNPYQIHHLL